MYAALQSRHVPNSGLLRWSARTGGVIAVVAWLGVVMLEAARSDVAGPSAAHYYQAAALALVFAGYALGWRKELAGGVLAIMGTIAFFAVHVLSFGSVPDLGAASFAVPGVLYVLASKFGGRPDEVVTQL